MTEKSVDEQRLDFEKAKFDWDKSRNAINTALALFTSFSAIFALGISILSLRSNSHQAQNSYRFDGLRFVIDDKDKLFVCGKNDAAQISQYVQESVDLKNLLVEQFGNNDNPNVRHVIMDSYAATMVPCLGAVEEAAVENEASGNQHEDSVILDQERYSLLDDSNRAGLLPSNPPKSTTVYIQYYDNSQKQVALRLTKALQTDGYNVPALQRVNGAPAQAQLRYYYKSQLDTGLVPRISEAIAGVPGFATPQTDLVSGYDDLPTGIVEYWFPRQSK